MKNIVHIVDIQLIKDVLSRDNVYKTVTYDNSPKLADYVPQGLWFLLLEGEMIAGIANLEPMNNVMWTCHVIIFKEHRGHDSDVWGKQVVKWMRHNVGARKFLGLTPYKAAKKYAKSIGFECIGILKGSIQKNGKLMDQYMLELGEEK